MPRYRFRWDNIPVGLLGALCRDLQLEGDPAAALSAAFGVRPKSDFVKSAWPSLLERWLRVDAQARRSVVADLRSLNLGDLTQPADDCDGEAAYLESCRNAKSLRDVVLWYFLQLGESSVAPTPPSPQERTTGAEPVGEVHVSSADVLAARDGLTELLDTMLREVLGTDVIQRDSDGDVPIRKGSAVCFVRVSDNPPLVHIFAPLVREIEKSPELLDALNEINVNILFGRIFLAPSKEVYVAAEIPAETLSVPELGFAIDVMTQLADHFDTRIRERFGGSTMLDDEEETVDV